jgi:hypothetical protein
MIVSACASATSTRTRCSWASNAEIASISSRSQSRTSVATWSLRGAAGVQALAGIADQRGQARLDVEVNVLEIEPPVERTALDLLGDLREAALDRRQIVGRDDACAASISAWARLPAMSARQSRRSNPTLAV